MIEAGARMRWVMLAVLTSITIINYVDRQTISILYAPMTAELHLPDSTYSTLITAFLIAYTAMYAVGGWLVDRIGTCNGLVVALSWWSVATMLTATVHSGFSLQVFRVMLALGQPIVFSAGVKACAEIFPQDQRAMASGIFSAGAGIGSLIATPVLAAITLRAGWRTAVAVPGLFGLLLVPAWIVAYRFTPKLPVTEIETRINLGWRSLLRQRKAWALVLPRALGDPLWYFCFFWIPTYLATARHLDLKQLAMYGWLPFLFADLGSILGGSFSDMLIRHGYAPVRARLSVLAVVAIVAPIGALAGMTSSLWIAICLLGLMAFASQCWTTTTVALATDMFPRSHVGSVVGLMGTAGGLGGAVFSHLSGITLQRFGYRPLFTMAALLLPSAVCLLINMLHREKERVYVK